ncbi:MAG: hypothetical protein ACU84J_12595 [Gammaproteobacteria bacterium]
MDIDTVIILTDPMDTNKLNRINHVFEELRNFETTNIGITYAIAEGPIKPLPHKQINIFFHVLLHSVTSYKKSPLILVKNSWQYESHHLIGAPLAEIEFIPEPNLLEITNGLLGIKHCKELIENKKSSYFFWANSHNHCRLLSTEVKFNEVCETLEICFYSILRAASNSLRFILGHSWGIGIDAQDMALFEQVFAELKLSTVPSMAIRKKECLRQGAWHPTSQDVAHWVDVSLAFLEDLETRLSHKKKLNGSYSKG